MKDLLATIDLYDDDTPGMADGGRIGFDNGGKTSKVKTKEFQYPVKFKNLKTGEIETVYRKEPIDYEARGKRVSTKVDTYKTALDDFQKQVDDAIQSKDVSKLPKSFAQFLKDKGLKSGTYFALLDNNQIPKIETDTSKIRLNFANNLIKEANQGFKFINAENLFKDAGFTSKEYKSLYATKQLLRLDKAEDKVGKSFVSLIHPRGSGIKSSKIVDLFNPVEKIAELTGLNRSIVSKRLTALNIKKESPQLHRVFKLLGNPNFKKNISTNFPDVTLTELMRAPKSFFADYAQSKAAGVRKGRLETAAKKAGEGVADINKAQDEVVSLLNKFYKENPQELLGNTKLRNLLDLTLKDGEIVKKNKYVKDEDFLKLIKDKPGLFTIDHVDEVQFEKLSTEFPVFRQLATYNTNSGLIRSIKAYVAKNQNSKDPVVQNKIKKQIEFLEDLKLRVDTPTGRIGSKEVLAAVDRKAGVLPNFLAQLRALDIKLPGKAKAALLGIGGGLGLNTFVSAGPIEETGTTGFTTGEKLAGAGTAAGAYKFRKPIIKGAKAVGRTAMKALGPLAAPLELAFIGADLKSGSSVPEALANVVMAGGVVRNLEKQKFIKDKYGKNVLDAYNAQTKRGITDYLDMPTAMPELSKKLQTIDAEADQHVLKLREQRAKEFERKSKLPKPEIDEFQAAGGGIAKLAGDRSGAMLESMNPDKDGLQGLIKRVRNL